MHSVGVWVFRIALGVVAAIFLWNWTPFERPTGMSPRMDDPLELASTAGQEYMARRQRFHGQLFALLAVCYVLQWVW